ncbi:GumC family protein [Altererythrobacter sp. MF3-039]|uniref:GumC family protein n=1 Tax=Altererythrobacter sp. MF3-039 TaxID=3252901 RepID=UPI00390CB296
MDNGNLVKETANGDALDLSYPRREAPRSTPFQRLRAIFYRQQRLLLVVFLTIFILGTLFILLMPREYTSVATVQIEQQASRILPVDDLDPQPSIQDSDRFLQTQLDLIKSRALAEIVSAELDIAGNPRMLEAIGIDPESSENLAENAVLALQERMDAQLGLNTRIARVTFTSHDPVVSAQIANGFASQLIDFNINSKLENSTRALRYLEEQLADAKEKLESSENRMLAYARNAGLTRTVTSGTGDPDQGGSLRVRRLAGLTDALSAATAERVAAEQQWQQARGSDSMHLAEVQGNRAIQDLMTRRAEIQSTLAEEQQRRTDSHPIVRELKAQLLQIDGDVETQSENVRQSIYQRYAASARQERQLNQEVAGLRASAMAERERGVRFNSLQREVDTNKIFYDGLLQRYRDVASASGAPSANISLVDRAEPQVEASSPDVGQNIALSGILAAIVALMAGLLRDQSRKEIHSIDDFERTTGLPALGAVPALPKKSSMTEALSDPTSQQSEALNSIAVALPQMFGGLPNTILITSSVPKEGKTATSYGLARSLALVGRNVVLVDGDLRRPAFQSMFAGISAPGLKEVLEGEAKPSDALETLEGENFRVVGGGAVAANPVQLLNPDKLRETLTELQASADVVIVDGPPVLGLADAPLLAEVVDAVLFVGEANWVEEDQLAASVARLPKGPQVAGILTKFDPRLAGVRYDEKSYYGY